MTKLQLCSLRSCPASESAPNWLLATPPDACSAATDCYRPRPSAHGKSSAFLRGATPKQCADACAAPIGRAEPSPVGRNESRAPGGRRLAHRQLTHQGPAFNIRKICSVISNSRVRPQRQTCALFHNPAPQTGYCALALILGTAGAGGDGPP